MTVEEALAKLGDSTADAVAGALGALAPNLVERGPVTVAAADAELVPSGLLPAVAAAVSYVDGVKGGNLFLVSRLGARRLAAAMMGAEPPAEDDGSEPNELELSAVSEAANQMLAAAAAATSGVLGEQIEIGPPRIELLTSPDQAAEMAERTPHVVHASFSLLGEPCRLIQLVPNAFVVRMNRAFGAQSGAIFDDSSLAGDGEGFDADMLRGVGLRVWAELGRAHVPVGRAVGLGSGSVVELDREVDDPVDVFVNGRRFATGTLLVTEDGEWAVRVDSIEHVVSGRSSSQEGVN